MSWSPLPVDPELLEVLREHGPTGVRQIAQHLGVTATAIRQRLGRLLAQGLVSRQLVRAGRGRPQFSYELTQEGLRAAGTNLPDLAVALWEQLNKIADPELRRELLRQVARRMAAQYAPKVAGLAPQERLAAIARLLEEKRIPTDLDLNNGQAALMAHACPYPELAQKDRTICELEQMIYSQLLGSELNLAECRLDGRPTCRFQIGNSSSILSSLPDRS